MGNDGPENAAPEAGAHLVLWETMVQRMLPQKKLEGHHLGYQLKYFVNVMYFPPFHEPKISVWRMLGLG